MRTGASISLDRQLPRSWTGAYPAALTGHAHASHGPDPDTEFNQRAHMMHPRARHHGRRASLICNWEVSETLRKSSPRPVWKSAPVSRRSSRRNYWFSFGNERISLGKKRGAGAGRTHGDEEWRHELPRDLPVDGWLPANHDGNVVAESIHAWKSIKLYDRSLPHRYTPIMDYKYCLYE